ncbi:DUF6333 family protein [Streptomyces sp. RS10V-4]|uniref:DUF6333 family protein n=1 Tax=Streptomyces rhizoryzae TaxID=2932493 RepID=UPI00200652DF|nr:DUF6333 family protein [Streptomyces rhizoryzae]MCK7627545.1 DUF6333 family protein [Streptomyces rhizoryzae]
MTDTEVCGCDHDPQEEVALWRGADITLSLLFPPFPDPVGAVRPALPPHDPVRARAFAEQLGTVAEVLEVLPARPLGDLPQPEVRADLDHVAVGCWGGLVQITDPALGCDLVSDAMSDEIAAQRARHPQARIVGSVEVDHGNAYLEDEVVLPTGEHLFAGGWDCDGDEGWEYRGDPDAILRAIGADPETAAEAGFEPDGEPYQRDYGALGAVVLGLHRPVAGGEERQVSVFRVRRSRRGCGNLREVWFRR